MALKISGVFKGKMAVEVTVIPQAIALVHGITKLMYPRHVMDEQTEFGAKVDLHCLWPYLIRFTPTHLAFSTLVFTTTTVR